MPTINTMMEIKEVEKKMTNETKPLLGKVVIQGVMKCETGLHIGASQETLEIGRMDILVQRNPLTKEPYVPGSSLKGKMRSLLERIKGLDFNRPIKPGYRHECDDREEALNCEVCRLFGSTAKGENQKNHPARLIVRDLHFTQYTHDRLEKIESDFLYTERKWENTLDRVTSAADPRQIERVPAESEFFFELVYAVEVDDKGIVKKDIENILNCLEAIELDALGGHGSRGYGKVKFWIIKSGPRHLKPDDKDYKTFDELRKLKIDDCEPLDFFVQYQSDKES